MEGRIKKKVSYSPETKFGISNKKSTTSFDMHGNIIRPIIVNDKYFFRHDKFLNIF